MDEETCRGPADYDPARDGTATFYFTDPVSYPCFPDGTLWNGFDNVAVSRQTRDLIADDWQAIEGMDAQTIADLRAIPSDDKDRISLGWGYATQLDDAAMTVVPTRGAA